MKTIQLTKNQIALVDNEDFEKVNKHKWCAKKGKLKNNWYAYRSFREQGMVGRKWGIRSKRHGILMHREILSVPNRLQIDHINGNSLDNRKCNLRICTNAQNQHNRKPNNKSTSKYKGVNWHKNSGKWRARIKYNYKRYSLGYFDKEIMAAIAYDKKAVELFGEFARLNMSKEISASVTMGGTPNR